MQLDSNGSVVVKYVYDAWGNCKVLDTLGDENTDATHIGVLNPFRYRSYYFDVETKFYFLKTRYYDPEIARFITIDDIAYLSFVRVNALNLYAYCRNNPVCYYDNFGTFWEFIGSFANKLINAYFNSLEIEGGIGYGLGGSFSIAGAEASAEAYADIYTIKLDDSNITMDYVASANIGISVAEQNIMSREVSFSHTYDDCGKHNVFSNPFAVGYCEHSKGNVTGSQGVDNAFVGVSGEDIVIGISSSKHIGIGAHYSVGLNISQFFRELLN